MTTHTSSPDVVGFDRSKPAVYLRWICLLLLVATPALSTPTVFGPYTVTGILPVSFDNLGGLAFKDNSLYAFHGLGVDGGIHQLDPATGQVLGAWTVPLGNPNTVETATGLAWDGSSFWMSSYASGNQNYLRRITLGPGSSVTINATYNLNSNWAMDLTYANGILRYPEYLGAVRSFNPVTGTLVGSVPSPDDLVYGLTFDGQSLLAAYPFGGRIWRISPQTGAILDTWETGASSIYSLGYDLASQRLFIGTANDGIIVAQAPEPRSLAIGMLGAILLLARQTKSPKTSCKGV